MAEIETGLFRSESNQLIHMDLPLPEHMQDKVTRGLLVRVNDDEDNTPYTGEATDASAGAGVTERPAVAAPKSEWVGWARHCDANLSIDDAEAMTKQDLIVNYGSKGS
jgi:hypothetical protein